MSTQSNDKIPDSSGNGFDGTMQPTQKGFSVISYRGKRLNDATKEELREVVDDMAKLYATRLKRIRGDLDIIAGRNDRVRLSLEEYETAIKQGVARLTADLGLDV